jgi:hypothetical protein
MKKSPSYKPAVNSTLALFIALAFHPGLGWTPNARGFAFSAAELTRVVFPAGVLSMGGGHRPLFPQSYALFFSPSMHQSVTVSPVGEKNQWVTF